MAHNQVIFQAGIDLQVIFQAGIDLAEHYTSTAVDNATTTLLDAQQAMLLEVLSEFSPSQIGRQKLLALERANVGVEFFGERLQIALNIFATPI